MADLKISELTVAATDMSGARFPVAQAGATKYVNDTVMTEIIQDAAAALLTGGVHSGISFNYEDSSDRVSATVISPTSSTDFKESVVVATTVNITLSAEQTIDGVLTSASRVLVKNQSNGTQNGIYVSAAGAWSRSTDADGAGEITPGMLVLVEEGTVSANLIYICTNIGTITIGTTSITFAAVVLPFTPFIVKTAAGTTYTHLLVDSGRRLMFTNAAAKTFTIAPASSVNSAMNTEIEAQNVGAGLLTVAPGAGVTINSLNSVLTVPQYHCVKLKRVTGTNTWAMTGIALPIATAAEIQANTASKAVSTDKLWSATTEVTLTDAATIAVDMATFINAKVTLAGNRTLGQPSNTKVGQSGVIQIVQDGTGTRTLAYHADWYFAGGTDPVLSTAINTKDLLFYQVIAANIIYGSLIKAIA